jgi:hypothetical protein
MTGGTEPDFDAKKPPAIVTAGGFSLGDGTTPTVEAFIPEDL